MYRYVYRFVYRYVYRYVYRFVCRYAHRCMYRYMYRYMYLYMYRYVQRYQYVYRLALPGRVCAYHHALASTHVLHQRIHPDGLIIYGMHAHHIAAGIYLISANNLAHETL